MQTTDFVTTVFDGKSNPNKVTVAFTMALNAVLKGHSATVILMVEAVELGKPGAATGMDIGKPFEPVADLMQKYLDNGGNVAICRSCMIHNGMAEAQMDPRFKIITAPEVVELLMGAKGSLQIA
ncbi:MAG: DsrE family protein [Burkholderiales bacterium]|nr:DsrE family protein [Burkholderiales bacterium]